MKDYLLFIDTEATGLPKNWNLPYEAKGNWPCSLQISWVICTKDGRKVKEENHYIKNAECDIEESAKKIHGITRPFLLANGEYRKDVLQLLSNDLLQYSPLVAGHFIQFDFHILGADFYREGMEDTISKSLFFCTMMGSKHLVQNPSVEFLRLERLYETLFAKTLQNPHNAIVDANATALCFFELMKRGEINGEIIEQQQKDLLKKDTLPGHYGCFIPVLVIICLTLLIFFL